MLKSRGWFTFIVDAVRLGMRNHCSSQGHAWLKDDEATQCKQCQKEFSISRRKVRSAHPHYISLESRFR